MKSRFLALLFVLAAGEGWGQIQFVPFDIAALKSAAKKQDKLILLNFTAGWCTPCQTMKRETFLNVAVGDFYNAHFICSQVDTDKNKSVASGFKVEILPDFVVLNAQGEEVYRFGGYHQPQDFLAKGEKALKVVQSGKDQTPLDRIEWCADMEKWESCNEALCLFLAGEEWKTPKNAALILRFAVQHNDVAIRHYIQHRSAFEPLISARQLVDFKAALAMNAVTPTLEQADAEGKEPQWLAIQDTVCYYVGEEQCPLHLLYAKQYFYWHTKQWALYFEQAEAILLHHLTAKPSEEQVKVYREAIHQWINLLSEEDEGEEIDPRSPLGKGTLLIYKYLQAWEALEHSAEVYELLVSVTESLSKDKESDYYYELWQHALKTEKR